MSQRGEAAAWIATLVAAYAALVAFVMLREPAPDEPPCLEWRRTSHGSRHCVDRAQRFEIKRHETNAVTQ